MLNQINNNYKENEEGQQHNYILRKEFFTSEESLGLNSFEHHIHTRESADQTILVSCAARSPTFSCITASDDCDCGF